LPLLLGQSGESLLLGQLGELLVFGGNKIDRSGSPRHSDTKGILLRGRLPFLGGVLVLLTKAGGGKQETQGKHFHFGGFCVTQ